MYLNDRQHLTVGVVSFSSHSCGISHSQTDSGSAGFVVNNFFFLFKTQNSSAIDDGINIYSGDFRKTYVSSVSYVDLQNRRREGEKKMYKQNNFVILYSHYHK